MHTEKEVLAMRKELEDCANPLFLFHDDQDGLSSFLQLYKWKGGGRGIVISNFPRMIDFIVRKVGEYGIDKIFILDIPVVSDEFFLKINIPVVWIDHHEPANAPRARYFNVKIKNKKAYVPVSYTCYQITQGINRWISIIGCIGDAFLPPFYKSFSKEYPDILPGKVNRVPEITMNTKLGVMSKIFSFSLKGSTADVRKCINILTRIKSPYEILERQTPQGKHIYNHFYRINEKFQRLLKDALSKETDGKMLVYVYTDDKMALSAILANELSYIMPEHFIILARLRDGEYKMSLRYNKNIIPILQKALAGIDGKGGGHPFACGAAVKEEDFPRFVQNIKEQL